MPEEERPGSNLNSIRPGDGAPISAGQQNVTGGGGPQIAIHRDLGTFIAAINANRASGQVGYPHIVCPQGRSAAPEQVDRPQTTPAKAPQPESVTLVDIAPGIAGISQLPLRGPTDAFESALR